MKKKVIFLIPTLAYGGSERVLSRISKLLVNDYDIKIIVFNNTSSNYDFSCEILPLFKYKHFQISYLSFPYYFLKLSKILTKLHPDLVVSFGNKANLLNVLIKVKSIKIISIRGFRTIELHKGFLQFFKTLIIKFTFFKASFIYTVSKDISKYIKEKYSINDNKIFTIENGFNSSEIFELSHIIPNLNYYPFQDPTKKRIISVGTYRIEKGYWNLLKSFSYVLKKLPNVELVLMGSDPFNHKGELQKLSKILNIEKNVHLLDLQKNPYFFMRNSSIYALSSLNEGFPNSMVEAMILALPIVAVDCQTGPNEILNPFNKKINGENFNKVKYGLLCPQMTRSPDFSPLLSKQHKIFANAIVHLLESKSQFDLYSSKAYSRGITYDVESWKLKLINMFDRAINKK